jgi:hypothetical protein
MQKEPARSDRHLQHRDTATFVGLDVNKDSITSAVLTPGSEVAILDRFAYEGASIRRFVTNLGDPGLLFSGHLDTSQPGVVAVSC